MTGTSPAANGAVGFRSAEWTPQHTLPGVLQRHGYQTHLIGKLHLDPPRKRFGFDAMELADSTRGNHNDYVSWLEHKHHRSEYDPGMAHGVAANGWVGRPHHLPEEQMHTFWCFDRALKFLKRRDPSMPFFLKISMIDPHPPLTPPAFYYDRYIHRDLPPPVKGDWVDRFPGPVRGLDPNASEICLSEHDQRCAQAAYYGMINFIDDQMGRFMQAASAELSNTLIIFTSDHGEMLGDHQKFRKTWPYEASARVPFLIRAPRTWKLPGGIVSDCPVGLQDIMPTFLDGASVPIPDTCTGRSLLPILRGQCERVRDVLHGEHAGCYETNQGNHYLTDGRMKYIWYSQTGQEHLFDLQEDPNELHDLARLPEGHLALQPWRDQLIAVFKGRPEGFTDGKALIVGQPHTALMPDYQPDRMTRFL